MTDCVYKAGNSFSPVISFCKKAEMIKSKIQKIFRKKTYLSSNFSDTFSPVKPSNYPVLNLFDSKNLKIVAYPDSDLKEMYSIMLKLGLNNIQIAQTPWNKKIVKVIARDELERIIKCSR